MANNKLILWVTLMQYGEYRSGCKNGTELVHEIYKIRQSQSRQETISPLC